MHAKRAATTIDSGATGFTSGHRPRRRRRACLDELPPQNENDESASIHPYERNYIPADPGRSRRRDSEGRLRLLRRAPREGYVEQKNSPCEGCSKPKSTMERSSSGLSIKSRKLELCTPTKWPLAEEGSGGGGRREAGWSARGAGKGARRASRIAASRRRLQHAAAAPCGCIAARGQHAGHTGRRRHAAQGGDGIPTARAGGHALLLAGRGTGGGARTRLGLVYNHLLLLVVQQVLGVLQRVARVGGAAQGWGCQRNRVPADYVAQIPTSGRPKRGKRRRGEGRRARRGHWWERRTLLILGRRLVGGSGRACRARRESIRDGRARLARVSQPHPPSRRDRKQRRH